MLLNLLLACSSPSPQSPPAPEVTTPPPAPEASPDATATTRARQAMGTLGTTLKAELKAKMAAGGPTAALDVCSTSAQSLTASVGRDRGVAVGRSSLRLRNPANAGPEWVTAWLKEQGERPAEGVQAVATSATDADGEPVVRVVGPLAIEAQCLVCHGPEAGRAPDLAAALASTYPQDRANGYALGDLRGAIWAEVPVVDTGLDLPLDGDQKWQLDDSTRDAMVDLRSALETAPASVDGAHQTAEAVSAALAEMIAGCKMTGASHDQLHKFLEAVFPAVEALKQADDPQQATDRREVLLALVAQFDAAFE